jgi:hypothetical protein
VWAFSLFLQDTRGSVNRSEGVGVFINVLCKVLLISNHGASLQSALTSSIVQIDFE